MRRILKPVLTIGISVLAAGVLFQCGYIGLRLNEALSQAQDSSAFQLLQPDAATQILVVGDDAGVGTGAALSSASVAGQIAQHYPCVSVVNRARDGATVGDVTAQIDGTGNTHFDLLLVLAGANDTLRLTGADALTGVVTAMLAQAKGRADHVIFLNSGWPGSGWLLPLRGWYQRQTRETARVLSQAARAARVEYLDARSAETANPVASRFAAWHLYPDDDAYARWYRLLMRESQIASILQC